MSDFGGGFVSGFMQAQANKRAKAQLQMQQQAMQMQMQKAQVELRAMQKEEAWQNGRAAAAKDGGMEGVIDYTMTTRPEEGLKLLQAKQEYQNSILKGDYAKSTIKGQDLENTTKGLKAAGDMYGQLTQMYQKNPDMAQEAYAKNIDLIKQMDPNAPPKFDPDRASLAIGLAVPQSERFKAIQEANKLQSQVGKDIHDLQRFQEEGNTMGSEAILQKMQDDQVKIQVEKRRKVKLDLQIGNINQTQEQQLRKEYTSNTKDYAVMGETMQKMEGLVQSDDILTNPAKQMALINQYARMNSPGIVTELNEKDAAKSPLLDQLWQLKQSVATGAPLPESAVKSISSAMRAQWKGVQPFLKDQKEYYQGLAEKYGLDPDKVIPSTFDSINKQEAEGELISSIKEKVPGFSVNKFIEANVKATPELGDYLKDHPEYKSELLQKYHSQITAPVDKEQQATPVVPEPQKVSELNKYGEEETELA